MPSKKQLETSKAKAREAARAVTISMKRPVKVSLDSWYATFSTVAMGVDGEKEVRYHYPLKSCYRMAPEDIVEFVSKALYKCISNYEDRGNPNVGKSKTSTRRATKKDQNS